MAQKNLGFKMLSFNHGRSRGGIKASSLGHKVIMSPLTDGCYLDYKHFDTEEEPGMHKVTTVADSYNYSPIKPG